MKFRQILLAFSVFLVFCATGPHLQAKEWSQGQLDQLLDWVAQAPVDALPVLPTSSLEAARNSSDDNAIDAAANSLALHLTQLHLLGSAAPSQRAGWHITDSDAAIDVESWLGRALAADALNTFFATVRPSHPEYQALRAAYSLEQDTDRRLALARNMERWRWMPRSLGKDYVWVNAAFFEAHLWRNGKLVGTWPIIVGKRSTPTPVFSAKVTGVILNPWWNIPASIVREMRGRFPASKGYVYSGGRWRQRPGPGNALGQMKLVMPNPYSVYMHDTPSKHLFEREERAFSHGCIRTGDALGYAATLLEGVKSREEIDAIVASRRTTQIDLPAALPIYVTYFTAGTRPDGSVTIQPDIYRRDDRVGDAETLGTECSN